MTQLQTIDKSRDLISFDDAAVKIIRETIAPAGTTQAELNLFLYQCKKTGLDPIAKQIYLQKRGGKVVIITGIDGYRLVADRTGKYAGSDDAVYDDEDKPRKASVTVYKMIAGMRCAFTASARWDQYYPGDGPVGAMWRKMPHLMLGKCAEALALRKAFPAELSGVYTKEEMEQADRVERPATNAATIEKAVTAAPKIEAKGDEPELFDCVAHEYDFCDMMGQDYPTIPRSKYKEIAQHLHGKPWSNMAESVQAVIG